MYKIVIFSDENSCEGVPSSWVVKVGVETHCLWPKTTIANLNKMIKNGEMPSKSWSSVKCRVKSEARDFKEMIEKRLRIIQLLISTVVPATMTLHQMSHYYFQRLQKG